MNFGVGREEKKTGTKENSPQSPSAQQDGGRKERAESIKRTENSVFQAKR